MAFGFGSGSSLNKTANDNSRRKPIKSLKENSKETVHSTKTLISEDNQISKEELLLMREKNGSSKQACFKDHYCCSYIPFLLGNYSCNDFCELNVPKR